MSQFSRREVLKLGALLAAGLGLDSTYSAVFAEGLQKISNGQAKVLWLQGMSCSGCSVSFLNSDNPGPADILTTMISLVYHSTISAAQGTDAMRVIDQAIAGNDFVLVLEGSVPVAMPEACTMGGRTLESILTPALEERQGHRGRRHLCGVWRYSGRRRKPDRRHGPQGLHGEERNPLPEPLAQLSELSGPSGKRLGHVGVRRRQGLSAG